MIKGDPQTSDFAADIAAVTAIGEVRAILDDVCRLTGMHFAAVARVTGERWVVCVVKDEIAFGLEPGDELEVETTICDEIRDIGEGVFIDHVSEEPRWRVHHTPIMYGFQSYISMPIMRADGSFFGTLCAIDPEPRTRTLALIVQELKDRAARIAAALDTQMAV